MALNLAAFVLQANLIHTTLCQESEKSILVPKNLAKLPVGFGQVIERYFELENDLIIPIQMRFDETKELKSWMKELLAEFLDLDSSNSLSSYELFQIITNIKVTDENQLRFEEATNCSSQILNVHLKRKRRVQLQ